MIKNLYRTVAVLLLNTLILFLLLNGVIWIFELSTYGGPVNPLGPLDNSVHFQVSVGSIKYGFDALGKVYPGMSDAEIAILLLDVWNIPFMCDPDTLFREHPYKSKNVNVHPAGFRFIRDQGPWPPDDNAYNVFVFGGSTTFGYGESDKHTIPSYLQQHLRSALGSKEIFVYNFGHAFFFSLQEKWEFQRLIGEGVVPDLAIFIDGINDFYNWNGQPHNLLPYRDPLATAKNWLHNTLTCDADEICWPIQRLANRFLVLSDYASSPKTIEPPLPPNDDTVTNTAVIHRWLENKREIEESAPQKVKTVFVLQPVPVYAYDLTYHPFAHTANTHDLNRHLRPRWGYAIWEEMAATNPEWTSNFLNLAHLGEDKQVPLYVDSVHYTAAFMDEIALAIAGFVSKAAR